MKLSEVLRIIKAMRLADTATGHVTIDRISTGKNTFGVRVSGKDVRLASRRAQEIFDTLNDKYNEINVEWKGSVKRNAT